MRLPVATVCLLLVSTALPQLAQAGMGNRDATPKWHPEPCQGDACRADDPRAGVPCQGLLCSFSSAKALQPPVTAAQAAEAQQKAAAQTIKPLETTAPAAETTAAETTAVATTAVRKKRVRHIASSDGPTGSARANRSPSGTRSTPAKSLLRQEPTR